MERSRGTYPTGGKEDSQGSIFKLNEPAGTGRGGVGVFQTEVTIGAKALGKKKKNFDELEKLKKVCSATLKKQKDTND